MVVNIALNCATIICGMALVLSLAHRSKNVLWQVESVDLRLAIFIQSDHEDMIVIMIFLEK